MLVIDGEEFINTEELMIQFGLKWRSQVTALTKKGGLPYVKPSGKRKYFKKSDIIAWLNDKKIVEGEN